MASLATAARESMGSVLPHLPSMPSLPQPHELPLVDAGSVADTAAAAAARGVSEAAGAAGAAPSAAAYLVAARNGGQEGRSRGVESGDVSSGRGGAEAGVECGQGEGVEAGELVGDGGGVPLARADSKAPVVQVRCGRCLLRGRGPEQKAYCTSVEACIVRHMAGGLGGRAVRAMLQVVNVVSPRCQMLLTHLCQPPLTH